MTMETVAACAATWSLILKPDPRRPRSSYRAETEHQRRFLVVVTSHQLSDCWQQTFQVEFMNGDGDGDGDAKSVSLHGAIPCCTEEFLVVRHDCSGE